MRFRREAQSAARIFDEKLFEIAPAVRPMFALRRSSSPAVITFSAIWRSRI
jgi:hypothetical protein